MLIEQRSLRDLSGRPFASERECATLVEHVGAELRLANLPLFARVPRPGHLVLILTVSKTHPSYLAFGTRF